MTDRRKVRAIDLFCGVGGLSRGLLDAGIEVVAGIDIDPKSKYPFEKNIGGTFLETDVRDVTADVLNELWGDEVVRLLAGCAPCQPFSSHRRGADTSKEAEWSLIGEFGRLVTETSPEFVTMENVTRAASTDIFDEFVTLLKKLGYSVSYKNCFGPEYGLPQNRRRLVLLASLVGEIKVPTGATNLDDFKTVRQTIGHLPTLKAGESAPNDPLHKARNLSELNLRRIRASTPGGNWLDWPEELRSPCHRKSSGNSFKSVYARMEWDEPSPTITTQSFNFGTGRFGHPEQDRSLTLREAAMLQGFPEEYEFAESTKEIHFSTIGRLIGNAVPPTLARAIGEAVVDEAQMIASS